MKEFMECYACHAKPGCPTLCEACLHNRALVGELLAENTLLRNEVELLMAPRRERKQFTERELERMCAGVRALHAMVDQTDPNDPIGMALTKAAL